MSNSFHWSYSSAVITHYVPQPLCLVRLAGFRLIEAGLSENLDVDCQPSLTMCCGLETEIMARAVRAGLVHMVQLASKTGATLAGKVFLIPRNSSHSPVSHSCDPHHSSPFWIILCSDNGKFELASSVLTSAAKVRLVSGIWALSCCPFCMLWLFQFEQSLRNADDPKNLHQQSIAQATVVYYCSRMEAVSLMPRQTYHILHVPVLSHVPRLGRRVTTP